MKNIQFYIFPKKPIIMKWFFLSVLVTVVSVSCKKGTWYDVKSNKTLAVPTTLLDMQALMDNSAIMNVNNPGLGEVASDAFYISESTASFLTASFRNAYTWTHEQPYLNVTDWSSTGMQGSYIKVFYANVVLDGLKKITQKSEIENSEFSNIKGQALFHRSKAFYDLSQIFAPFYQANAAQMQLGIPLRLEADVNIPSKRSSLQQTFDQILGDLMLAKDLLPENQLYATRPSKQAVYALLARIYLSIENYDQAGYYADMCLKGYNKLTNYNTLNLNLTGNPFAGYITEVIFYSSMFHGDITLSNALIDETLYNSYSNNDLRKKAFFNQNTSTKLVAYKGTYAGSGFTKGFTGLATDEIYLIRAECYARDGKTFEAINDLNALLKTRWAGTYVDITTVDKEDALKKVLEERKKELIMRGLRWSDLRRLNRDPRFALTLTRTIGGKTYTLEPNSYKYTFPIPDDVIQMTGMEQNEGWK